MATYAFQVKMASIMEVLTKTTLAEMTKLVDDAYVELRLEMCKSQRENEALKSKLQVMEGELRAARGCGEGTPSSSLNIALEVKLCDEFRRAENSKVGGEGCVVAVPRVFGERLSTGSTKDEQYVGLPVEKKKTVPDALEIKNESVDGEQDLSECVLLSEDWLEEDPKMSQSQLKRKISEEDACGTSGAAAANGGEGPLCEEEEELHMQPCPAGVPEKGLPAELKQELDEEPLTPEHPPPGSAEGLEVQCVWSKATRSGKVREMLRHHGGGSENSGVQSNDRFSPRHFRASRRLCSEKNEGATSHPEQQQNGRPRRLPDGISADVAFTPGSRGERTGSALCVESFDASAEAESRRRNKGREEFVCTRAVQSKCKSREQVDYVQVVNTWTPKPSVDCKSCDTHKIMADEDEQQIVSPQHLRSDVWKVFGFHFTKGKILHKDVVVCRICKGEFKYHSSTSNMRLHIQSAHPVQFAELAAAVEPAAKRARVKSYFSLSSTNQLPADGK